MKNKPAFTIDKETAMKAISNNIPKEIERIMKDKVVIFFNGFFKKIDADILLESEFDVDFDGQMMVRFLNASDGSVTAINGINGYGINIINEVAFKDAEIYFPNK